MPSSLRGSRSTAPAGSSPSTGYRRPRTRAATSAGSRSCLHTHVVCANAPGAVGAAAASHGVAGARLSPRPLLERPGAGASFPVAGGGTRYASEEHWVADQVSVGQASRLLCEPVGPFQAGAVHPCGCTWRGTGREVEEPPDAKTDARTGSLQMAQRATAPGAADRVPPSGHSPRWRERGPRRRPSLRR